MLNSQFGTNRNDMTKNQLLKEYYLELTGRLAPTGYYNPGDYENPPESEYDRNDALELFFDVPYEVIQTIEEQAEAYNKAHRVELTEDDVAF